MSGGPTKIEFLGHRDTNQIAAPCVLNYWRSSHYGGADVSVAAGEALEQDHRPVHDLCELRRGFTGNLSRTPAPRPRRKPRSGRTTGLPASTIPAQRSAASGQRATRADRSTDALGENVERPRRINRSGLFGGRARRNRRSAARTIDWQQDAKHYEFWVKGGRRWNLRNSQRAPRQIHAARIRRWRAWRIYKSRCESRRGQTAGPGQNHLDPCPPRQATLGYRHPQPQRLRILQGRCLLHPGHRRHLWNAVSR